MRLKESRCKVSPKTALELLNRIQKHRVTAGDRTYSGISKTTQEQIDIFKALDVPAP
jgi:hypothetical protein